MIPKQTEFTRRIPLLSMKQMDIDAKVAKKMVHAWDVLHSPERLREVFFQDAHRLSDPHYWELLRTVWVAAGSTDTADLFRPYFLSGRPCKSWFMTVEDAASLERVKFPLTVWRAYDREPDPGISWTIDRTWCEAYAKVHNRSIKERVVERGEVFAFVSRRHESEIIIL